MTRIHDATLKGGKYLAGPLAWKSTRQGYTFFQGPGETSLLKAGVAASLHAPTNTEGRKGVAPTEGSEK